jgi:SAM-dependent methyltransferase
MDDRPPSSADEATRIVQTYRDRDARLSPRDRFFGYDGVAHLVRLHDRFRATLRLLERHGFHPLTDVRFLDVGCGDGAMLRYFVQWGAQPANLAGIDLRPEAVAISRELSPNLDVRSGSATSLPWADASFDLVAAHTVFTSILDARMRREVAAEMDRVLRPGGAVLWYDFTFDNPRNPDVRGVKRAEILALFPGFEAHLRRISLAPPIARRIPAALLPVLYPLLASLPPLRTHVLGLLRKPGRPAAPATPQPPALNG